MVRESRNLQKSSKIMESGKYVPGSKNEVPEVLGGGIGGRGEGGPSPLAGALAIPEVPQAAAIAATSPIAGVALIS